MRAPTRPSAPRARCCILLAAAVLCLTLPTAAPATGADPVEALLAERVDALASGDLAAWMSTVDPAAPAAFAEAQRRQFEGLTEAGATDVSLTVDQAAGDLSPPGLERRHDVPVRLPPTELRYRLEGYDERHALDRLWWTYVSRGGSWYVAAADDLEVVGLRTRRQLWDLGPVETVRTDRVLVVSHPDRSARAGDVARLLEDALGVFDERWARPWSGRVVAVLPSSADELETVLQTTLDLGNFVAFVDYGVDRGDGYETTAPRLYLHDERLIQRSRSFQLHTLVHELVHVATAADAGPFVDSWVHEGLAEWVASGRPVEMPVPPGSDRTIPRSFELRTGERERILRSYAEAASVMAHLARTRGPDAPGRLFSELGGRRVTVGDTQHHLSDSLGTLFGLSVDGLVGEWAGSS